MASGEQVEEDLFGFAELTVGTKTPNCNTGTTNKTELVTDKLFDFDKQLIKRDNDEVIVPILFEKSGVKKYKILARHQAEDDEDIKRPESSERESPNSEEQRKENINITKKFENIQKQKTDDKKVIKRPKVKGNEKTIRIHSLKHLKQSSYVEKFPGKLSKLLKKKLEDGRRIEENLGKLDSNIVKDPRAVNYEFHGDSDSNSEFKEVKNKSELKVGIDNMNDKIVESDNNESVEKEPVKHPPLKIECHVKLRRDPSIESLYRINTECEAKDINAISNCDSVETTNKVSQNEIGHTGSTSSKKTNPVENISVCRQGSSEETKPKAVDMVYNVDVPVRKSGRLKSAKCASRYRGDYGIRLDTYNQLISKSVNMPSDCDTFGNSENVISAQVIGEIDKKDISEKSNSDRKLNTVSTCKSVRRIKHSDGIRCTVHGSDIVDVSDELNKIDSASEQFTGVKEKKSQEIAQDLVESGTEVCSGFERSEAKDFHLLEAKETEIIQPTKFLIRSKHKPDETDQEDLSDVCDDRKMKDLDEICDTCQRIAQITTTDVVEGQSENTEITEQAHCSTVTDHCSCDQAHEFDKNNDRYDSKVRGINNPEITNEVPCSELMKETQRSICDISSSSGILNAVRSAQNELSCNNETQMLTNRTVSCQAAEIEKVTNRSCDSQLALGKINETLVLFQRVCKDTDMESTGYVHSVGKSVNKIQQRIEISKPAFIVRQQNTDNDALPESLPIKDPAMVLETLRQKLFQNAGADVSVADRVPKLFESKLISSKQRQTGENGDETRSFLGIEDQNKDNKHVRDSDSASGRSGKSTPRCSTPRSEANKDILEEVAQSLDDLHKAKRKSANSNNVRPLKRQRFEEKKFLLRSMMKNVEDEESTITHDTRVEVEYLNENNVTAIKIAERTRSSRSSADSLNSIANGQCISKKACTKGKEVNSAKKNIGPQNDEKPIKPKPVKCSACNHIFKTKELLRKHYPCRIRQTRTWSQNKLRPNRALKRIENSSKKFICRLPKSGKSEGTKSRPQLLTYRKTKFRRVKGKRRRRLYQLLQDLKQKRMPVKWPHLSIVYNDLSFKEQFLYKIGLLCVGHASQGIECYTADEITQFEHHRAKVKLDTEDAQTFIHSTPDTIQELNENLTDLSVSTEFSTESDCFSPSVILFSQEIVQTKTNCDTSSAKQESIKGDTSGLAVVLSDSIHHSSTSQITSKDTIMPHSDAYYQVLTEIEADFSSEEVVELNECPEEIKAEVSIQSYTEFVSERKMNNGNCLIAKCVDDTVTRTQASVVSQHIAQLESLSAISQGTEYLEEVKELVETDLISITSKLVEHSHARVFVKESAVSSKDIEDSIGADVNEPSNSQLADITVDKGQQVIDISCVHNDEISKFENNSFPNKHSEYDDLPSSTIRNGQHVELSTIYADNKHKHENQLAKLTDEFGESTRSVLCNDTISLHNDKDDIKKDLFGSDLNKITCDIVNRQNEIDESRPDSVRKYSAESDRDHHRNATVDENFLNSNSISQEKLIGSEKDVSTKSHSKMVRRSRLQEVKTRANEISLFAQTNPEATLNPGLVLQARDMLKDILGDVEQTVTWSENIGLPAILEKDSEVNSHSNIGENMKYCKMITSDKTEHLPYSTYKGILKNSTITKDSSNTLAADISENIDSSRFSNLTCSVDIKKAMGKSGISPGKKKIDFQTYVKRKGMKKGKNEREKEYMRSGQHHEIADGLLGRLLDAVNVIDSIIEEQRDHADSSEDDTFSAITPEMAFEAAVSSNNVDSSQTVNADKPYDIECVFPYFEVDKDIRTDFQAVPGIMEVDQHTTAKDISFAGRVDVEKDINRKNIPVTGRIEAFACDISTGNLPVDGGFEVEQDIYTYHLPVVGRSYVDQDTSTVKLPIVGEIEVKQEINTENLLGAGRIDVDQDASTDNLPVDDINPDVGGNNVEANNNGDIETTEHVRLHPAEGPLWSNSDYSQEETLSRPNESVLPINEKSVNDLHFAAANIENNAFDDYSYIGPLQKRLDKAILSVEHSEDEISPDHVEDENEEDAAVECMIEQEKEQKSIVEALQACFDNVITTGEHTMSEINFDHVDDENEERFVECIIDQKAEDQNNINIDEATVGKSNNSSICDDIDAEELCEYKFDDVMKSPEQIPKKRVRKSNDGQSMKESSRDFTIKYEMNGIVIKENLLTGDKNVVENSSPFRSSVESDSICDLSELDTSAFENDSSLDSSIDIGSSDVPENATEMSNIVNSGLSSNENIIEKYKLQDTAVIIEPIHLNESSCTLESDKKTNNVDLFIESQERENKDNVEIVSEKNSFLEKNTATTAMDNVFTVITMEEETERRTISMGQDLNSAPYKLLENLTKNENILEDKSIERVPSLDIVDKSMFNKDLHMLRNVPDDLSASPPVLERVEVSCNNMDEFDEDIYSMEAVLATEGGPPILELEHFEQNEQGKGATDSFMLKVDIGAQKVKPERHFLDVLDIISSDPEETTTSPSIENEMDDAFLGENKRTSKYLLREELHCEESTVTDSIGRHFSDVVSDTKTPKTDLQFLFDKSERGEVTLAQIKEILTPISKKENETSIPKESLLKINAGIANLLSNVKHPVKKDPSWLKRDALSSYSRNKRIKEQLCATLGESESSGDKFYGGKEEPIHMSSDSSDLEEETLMSATTMSIKNPSKGSIADNILQMLTSLEDKGNIADNMCNLLDILAESLGFLGKTGEIVDAESSSDSDYSYSGETNVMYNSNSTAIIQKDLIANYLGEGDQPPSLDDIPTSDNLEDIWQKDINKSNESIENETYMKEIIIDINLHKEENTNETEETSDVDELSDNDSLVDNEETINKHDQMDKCNEKQGEPYDDCRFTISSKDVSYSSDSRWKKMCISVETSEFDDAEAEMESETVVGKNVYMNCDKPTEDVEEQPIEEQHKANTIFKSITELNSIETDEESDCGESFDQVSMSARMSELKAIAKDNTTWEFNSDYSSDPENSNQLESDLESETNIRLESISQAQHHLESNMGTVNHPMKATTKHSNIQYQKDEENGTGHSSATNKIIDPCISSNIESNITEKIDDQSALVKNEGDMQGIESSVQYSESEIAAESIPGISALFSQGKEMNNTCANDAHTLQTNAIKPNKISTINQNTCKPSVLNFEISISNESDRDISDYEKSQNIVTISTEEQLFRNNIQLAMAESMSASMIEENVDSERITTECKIAKMGAVVISQNAGTEQRKIENNTASREEHIPTVCKPVIKESKNIRPRESIMADKAQDTTDKEVYFESKYINDICKNELQDVTNIYDTNESSVFKFVEEDYEDLNDSCNKSDKKLSSEVNNEYLNIDHNISREVVEGYTKCERCLIDRVEVKVNDTDDDEDDDDLKLELEVSNFEHDWQKDTENSNTNVNIILSPELVEEDTNDTLTYDEHELGSKDFANEFYSSNITGLSGDYSNVNKTDVLDVSDNVNATWLPEEQDDEEDLIRNVASKLYKRVNDTGTCSDHNESKTSLPIVESDLDSVEKCTLFNRNSDSSSSEIIHKDAMLKQRSTSFNIDESDYSELFCESIAEKVKRKQRERSSSVCYGFNPWLYYSAAYVREATKPGRKEISVFRSSILEKRAREKSLTPDNVEDIGCSPRKKRNSSIPKEATATCNDETTEVDENGTIIPEIQFDLRPCSVDLQKLSEETIHRYTSKKRKLVDESSLENRPPIKVTIKYSQIVYPPNSPYGSASASSDTWRSGCGSCSEESETENDFEQSNDNYCLDSLQEKQITVMSNTTEMDHVNEKPSSMLDSHTEGSFSNRGPLKIKMRTLLTKMNSFEKDSSVEKSVQEIVPIVELSENFNETSNEATIEAGTSETIESEVLHDINRECERAKSRETDVLLYLSDSDSEIGPTSSMGGNKQCTKVSIDSTPDYALENKETFESPIHTDCGVSDVDLSDSDTDTDIQDEIDRILNVSSVNLTAALSKQFSENTNSTRTIKIKHSVTKMVVRDLKLSESESESEINLTVNYEGRQSDPEYNEQELIMNTDSIWSTAKYSSCAPVTETHNRNDTTKSYQSTSDKLENIPNNNDTMCSTSPCLAQPRNERFQEMKYAKPVQAKENVLIFDNLQSRDEEGSLCVSVGHAAVEKRTLSPQKDSKSINKPLDVPVPSTKRDRSSHDSVNEMEHLDTSSREAGRSEERTINTSVEITLEKFSDEINELQSFVASQQTEMDHPLKGRNYEGTEYMPFCISAKTGTALKPPKTYVDNIVSPLCGYRDMSNDNSKTSGDSGNVIMSSLLCKQVVADNAVKRLDRAGESTNVYCDDYDHSDEKQKTNQVEIDADNTSCDESREIQNDVDCLEKIPENIRISLCDSKQLENDSAVKNLEGDVFHDTQPVEDAAQNNMVYYAVELSDDFETNEAVVNLETVELIEGPLITENNDIHEENVDTSIMRSHVNDQFELPYEHVSEQIVETLDDGKLSCVLETKMNNAVESITQIENAVYYPCISAVKSKYLYGINEDSQSSNEVVEELVTDNIVSETVSHMTSENSEVLQHAHDPLILARPNAFTCATTTACYSTKDTFTDFLRMKNQQSEREANDLSNIKLDCSIDICNETCGNNSQLMTCATYDGNLNNITEPVTNYFNITTSENRDTSEMCSDNLSHGNDLTYSFSSELTRVHNTDVFNDNARDGYHHKCENSEMDSMDSAMILEQEVDTDYIITENEHFDNEEETMDML